MLLAAGEETHAGAQAELDLFVAFGDAAQRRQAFEVLREARSRWACRADGARGPLAASASSPKPIELGARYVAIVDGAETALKDMGSGQQETIDTAAVVHAVLRRIRELA